MTVDSTSARPNSSASSSCSGSGSGQLSTDMACWLVAAGFGIALVTAAQHGRIPDEVVLRPVADFDVLMPISIVWRRRITPQKITNFAETVEAELTR